MATSRKRTVEIDVVVDDKNASKQLKNLGDDSKKSAKGFSDLSGGMKAAALGAGAFVATNIVGFLGDAVTAAAEDERAQADLARQLETSTDATDIQIEAVEEYIKQTSLATGVTDDELRPAFETLARATGDATKAQELLTIAMDISAATGKPLQAVVEAISKAAQNGSTGGLARLGIKIKDVNGEMLTLDEIMQNAADTMGGAMATQAETASGKMAILNVKMEEAKEALGAQLMPTFLAAIEMFGNLVTKIAEVEAGWQSFGEELDTAREKIGFTGQTALEQVDAWENHNTIIGEATRGMEDARTHGLEPLTSALGHTADAEGDLTEAIKTTMEVRQDSFDQIKGNLDKFFAFTEAVDDQAEAQRNVTLAIEEFGKGSPEHIAALEDVATASLEVEDAQLEMLAAGGMTREEFEKQRIKMGLTAAEAQILIDKYDILFTDRTATFTSIFKYKGVQPTSDNPFRVPGQHTGGTVPGVPGQEVLINARAGEFVSQGGRDPHGNGHGGGDIVIQVDGREIARAVRPHAVRDSRTGRPWQ